MVQATDYSVCCSTHTYRSMESRKEGKKESEQRVRDQTKILTLVSHFNFCVFFMHSFIMRAGDMHKTWYNFLNYGTTQVNNLSCINYGIRIFEGEVATITTTTIMKMFVVTNKYDDIITNANTGVNLT